MKLQHIIGENRRVGFNRPEFDFVDKDVKVFAKKIGYKRGGTEYEVEILVWGDGGRGEDWHQLARFRTKAEKRPEAIKAGKAALKKIMKEKTRNYVTLDERVITKFTTSVQLKVEIVADTSKHAEDRKFRHEEEITDAEIRESVFKATEKILQAFLDGSIGENEKFLIYDPGNNHLNLVATFHMNDKGTPEKVKIVTIMRNKNFHARDVKRTFKV